MPGMIRPDMPGFLEKRMTHDCGGSVGRRTAIGAGWMVAFRLFTRLVGLASTLVLTRILVPADFGLLAMATSFSAGVEALSVLGIQDALIRRPERDRSLYDTAFTIQVGRALVTCGIVVLGAPLAATWFAEPRLVPLLTVLGLATALAGWENIGVIEFRRDLRFSAQFRLLALPRLVQVGVTIVLAMLLHDYWALLGGIIVARLGRLVMTYALHPYRPRFAITRWRELAGFSFWTWAGALASLVWDRADAFILGPMFGPGNLALFLLAGELALLPVSELVAPTAHALFSGFAAAQARGTNPIHTAPGVAIALVGCVVPLVIAISATAGDMVQVMLGPRWAAAQPLLSTLAVMCMMSPISYVSSTVLLARGLVRQNFIAVALMVVPKLVVVYLAARTQQMSNVAICNVALVGVECGIFAVMLHCAGGRFGEVAGDALRIAAAGSITLLLVASSGWGWLPATGSSMQALGHGLALGLSVLSIYASLMALLWLLAGRPEGLEALVFRLVRWEKPWPRRLARTSIGRA